MSERERWIVYPLLFLALGASLRDKIIKTTESQRIKCQGLLVYDERENKVIAMIGPEHFPEITPPHDNKDFIDIDRLSADRLEAREGGTLQVDAVRAKVIQANSIEGGLAQAQVVRAKTVQTDRLLGPALRRKDGQVSFPLWNWWSGLNLDPRTLFQQRPTPEPRQNDLPPADAEEAPTGDSAAAIEKAPTDGRAIEPDAG